MKRARQGKGIPDRQHENGNWKASVKKGERQKKGLWSQQEADHLSFYEPKKF